MDAMKVIVAGNRDLPRQELVNQAIEEARFNIAEVVSGAAPGADTFGEMWAKQNGVPCKRFPAEWTKYGKNAGPMRNQAMAKYGQALILVWDGLSKGSANMLGHAESLGLKIHVHKWDRYAEPVLVKVWGAYYRTPFVAFFTLRNGVIETDDPILCDYLIGKTRDEAREIIKHRGWHATVVRLRGKKEAIRG